MSQASRLSPALAKSVAPRGIVQLGRWPSFSWRESPLVSCEYRVFMVHQAKESTFLHLAAGLLRDGAVVEVDRPGSELNGRSVIVYSVLAHPVDGRPGIAYAREMPRLVSAEAFDTAPAGTGDSQRKGVQVSMQEQGGAQEPESPDQPDEQSPEQPGTTPDDDPSPVPDAPSDPDQQPSQSPPGESDNP